ncbi:HNH endonuclease [Clostridiales Family XIII bacterium ASD5510]|uniref:HNH endonuclease n=2 Tax=Bacteria TaxID=2 RepID=A0A9J6QU50_9FIRM|nr:HNH endonuclease signature motif containing protein [Hominibacterium faecale]MCU7379725.1 HNH endonuclease [Hominibacterium faecale]
MNNLQTFYRSREWETLTHVVRNERTADDGLLYCEHCGKPIVREYDAICHHMIALTDTNVNDATISLNPDNIQVVHHKCHNQIHSKLSWDINSKQVYLVWGCPLAGKTTYVQDVMIEGDLIIDVDSIWQALSGLDRYVKPGRLTGVVLDVRDHLIDLVRTRKGKWRNAYVIGSYPIRAERERLIKRLGAREIFIAVSGAEALRRASQLQDKRAFVDYQKFILEWQEKFTPPPTIEI